MERALVVKEWRSLAVALQRWRVSGRAGAKTNAATNVSPNDEMAHPLQPALSPLALSYDVTPNRQYLGSSVGVKGHGVQSEHRM